MAPSRSVALLRFALCFLFFPFPSGAESLSPGAAPASPQAVGAIRPTRFRPLSNRPAPAIDSPGTIVCHPRTIGYTPATWAFDLRLSARTAFVASSTGLESWDYSEPLAPKKIGRADFADDGWDFGLELVGQTAFVARESHLAVVDVSAPSDPKIVSTVDGVHAPFSVDGTLVAATRVGEYHGFDLFDISNPASPVKRGNVPNFANSIALHAGYLYLDSGSIWSVSNPASPVPVGSIPAVLSFAIDGTTLYSHRYVNNGSNYLEARSLLDPAHPALLWSWVIPSGVGALRAKNGRLLVPRGSATTQASVIEVWDVSSPAVPIRLGEVPSDWDPADLDGPLLVAISDWGQLEAWSVADFGLPRLESINQPAAVSGAAAAFGGRLAEFRPGDGLSIWDIVDPREPIEIGHLDIPSDPNLTSAGRLEIEGNRALLLIDDQLSGSGLKAILIDLSDPIYPRVESEIVGLARGYSFSFASAQLSGGRVVALHSDGVLRIWSLADPAHPAVIGSTPMPINATSVVVEGALAFADSSSGTNIFSIADPSAPALVGTTNDATPIPVVARGSILVGGGKADCPTEICSYLSDAIQDVSTPASPQFVSWIPSDGVGSSVSGAAAFVPSRPAIVQAYGGSSYPSLTSYAGNLAVTDVTTLAAPSLAGTMALPFLPYGVSCFASTSLAAVPLYTETRLVSIGGCLPGGSSGVLVSKIDPGVSVGVCKPQFGPTPSVTLRGSAQWLGETSCTNPAFAFQWFRNGIAIPGATSSLYATPASLPVGSHEYRLRARCGSDPSLEAVSRPTIVVVASQSPPSIESVRLTAGDRGRIVWSDVAGASSYEVRYDTSPSGTFGGILDTVTSGVNGEPWPQHGPASLFFEVRAVGACGSGVAPVESESTQPVARTPAPAEAGTR